MLTSVVMTLYDREPEIILNTLRSLRMAAADDLEVVIVDDNSSLPYGEILRHPLEQLNGRMVRLDEYACYQTAGGYNNPAKAFNAGLAEAQGERVILMSSDCWVPARTLHKAMKFHPDETIFCPMVVDMATASEYCGPNRVFPMPWFLSTSRQKCIDVGGWDENYLQGMCWEDNDFVGRLVLAVGSFTYDWNQVVWHQSHFQPAYVDDPWVRTANQRNRLYTADKWKGIPFDAGMGNVWEEKRGRHQNGDFQVQVNDIKGLLPDLIKKTVSPFTAQAVTP